MLADECNNIDQSSDPDERSIPQEGAEEMTVAYSWIVVSEACLQLIRVK